MFRLFIMLIVAIFCYRDQIIFFCEFVKFMFSLIYCVILTQIIFSSVSRVYILVILKKFKNHWF